MAAGGCPGGLLKGRGRELEPGAWPQCDGRRRARGGGGDPRGGAELAGGADAVPGGSVDRRGRGVEDG